MHRSRLANHTKAKESTGKGGEIMTKVIKPAGIGDISVKTEVKVSMQTLSSLLCSAFEGGTGYWCQIQGYKVPGNERDAFFSLHLRPDDIEFKHIWVPLTAKGVMKLGEDADEEGKYDTKHDLTRSKVIKGLQVMAKDYNRHFQQVITDNFDAETGDVFVQCCLFGKVIYG
jgi:hypothetical protein